MSHETLLIRADASSAMGTGHVMRCLALAQAWRDTGGDAVFAIAEATAAVRAKLAAESCEVVPIAAASEAEDAQQTVAVAKENGVAWVVLDGYQFGADYQRIVKTAGLNMLFLDDYGHAGFYCADVVLNQNVGIEEKFYPEREPQTRLLLGPRYSLLRSEFLAWRGWTREIRASATRVLVTMGGSDPQNVTARVIDALRVSGLDSMEAVIVVGGSNVRFDAAPQDNGNEKFSANITVRKDVSNMPELMAWADVAISAAGSTCWELCFMGLPSLLIDVAPNQSALARELGRRGCAIHLGGAQSVSATQVAAGLDQLVRSQETRRDLCEAARKLVDGFGARRVVSVLRGSNEIYLRRAQEGDARLLWEWANDPEVRAASFSSSPIPWETHVAWLEQKLGLADCLILIAEDEDGTPLGQIRFDRRNDGDAEVNITVAKEKRGRGLAARLIDAGIREQFGQAGCRRIHAFVKPENMASARAFARAGFIQLETTQVRANSALHFVCARP
jgi:UDP-2,4-diacetamido-2,4,6-trideoxy-beta-L-altropyranose hydrolase